MTNSANGSDHALDSVVRDILGRNVQLCLDVASVLIIARDSNGAVVTINKKGTDLLGYAEDEIVGKSWFDFVAREEQEESKRVFYDILEGRSGFVEYYERTVMTKSGEKRTLLFHNVPIKDANGLPVGIISSGEDVTNQKKLRESLAKEEHLNEVVADNLPIGYAANRISDGKVVFMNKKFEEIYGWPRDVIAGVDSFFEHVYPDPEFRKRIKEQVTMDMMSASPARMIWKNLPITRQSGETAYITAQNIPLYEYDLMISTVMDVSHEVKVEKTIREVERLQRAILDNIPDLAWVKDKNGVTLAVNEAFAKAINRSRDQIIGKTDYDLWDDKAMADAFRADDAQVLATGKQLRKQEYIIVPGTDIKVFAETIKMPIYNEDGTPFGVTGIARVIEDPSKA